MSDVLFDASALLAFLGDERGADTVEAALESGGACSAANWAEVAQKVRTVPAADWELSRALLLDYGLRLEPVLPEDAELAASLWRPGDGLSLGDRLCLATAQRLNAQVLTADAAWRGRDRVQLIR